MKILCNMGTAMDIIGTLGVNKWCGEKGLLNNKWDIKPLTFAEQDEIIRSKTEEALEDMLGFPVNVTINEDSVTIELMADILSLRGLGNLTETMKNISEKMGSCHIKVYFNIATTVCDY